MWLVDAILDHKRVGKSGKWMVLLRFVGYPASHNEWQEINPRDLSDWSDDDWKLIQSYANHHVDMILPDRQKIQTAPATSRRSGLRSRNLNKTPVKRHVVVAEEHSTH